MASASGKSATGSNPFDQIVALEEQEKQRVDKELAAMNDEKQQVAQSLSAKLETAETEMRDEAKAGLKEYREQELSKLLKDAEQSAKQRGEELKKSYESRSQGLIDELANSLLEAHSTTKA